MTDLVLEQEAFTLLTEDMDLPCDYADESSCSKSAAKWVLFLEVCCAGFQHRLACDGCKTQRMAADAAVERDCCGMVVAPARHAYKRVEAL